MAAARTFLGIESSCDDTGAAVVRRGPEGRGEILSNVVMGQEALHRDFGGVVPEIAARAHVERLDVVTRRALDEAGLGLEALDGLAVTAGPGLIGGLIAGTGFARGLAAGRGLPLYGINHLAGHALSPRLAAELTFPYVLLLASGGHGQFLKVSSPLVFTRLGGTIDDAPGEVFDKIARHIGSAVPGGRGIEILAGQGDARRFAFPRPLAGASGADMSFSGLKTAVRRQADALGTLSGQDRADLAAGLQAAVAEILGLKARAAIRLAGLPRGAAFAAAGGVAANGAIRAALQQAAAEAGLDFTAPPPELCTDNAAMIAWAALERQAAGATGDHVFVARPRWPLDEDAAPMLGSGKKGAKA